MPLTPPPPLRMSPAPRVLVAAIAVGGVLLSFGVFRYAKHLEANRVEQEFIRRAEVRHALTREIIASYETGVYALKCLFEGSVNVTRAEFREVARDIRSRYAGLAALEWAPVVAHADRAAWEQRVSTELGRSFEFTEASDRGEMIRARVRPEHFPIVYLEPVEGNERALGYDIKAAPTQAFLERARRSRGLAVSSQFPLVQSHNGIVMIWPVFAKSNGHATDAVLGYVQGVVRVDEILAQTELRSPVTSADMLYVDDTAETPAQRLLYNPSRDPRIADPAHWEKDFRQGPHREYTIELGGRRWIALYRPNAQWITEQKTHLPDVWLTAGLIITALLASLVGTLGRRTAAIRRDVTERTGELRESRRQLSSLLHALPGMAVRAISENGVRVTFVSEGARGLTGYEPEDFLAGRVRFKDVIHPADLENLRVSVARAMQSQSDVEIECRIRSRDGKEKWILVRGKGALSTDGFSLFEGLGIDITARKEAEAGKLAIERKLLHSQKLESIGLLAGGIAHDFNNLLSGIVGHANLARLQLARESPGVDHIKKIEAATSRAAELCQQMLAYAGRGQRLVEPVDLTALVKETLPLLQSSFQPQVRVQLELARDPTPILADATQIRQVAMNLIMNAADALADGGGELVVSTGRRQVDAASLAAAHVGENVPPGEFVFLEVRDTGCGMSPETLAKIFDPFFTTKFTGRGLGLAAVLGIVRGHQGALQVQSELGRGSTFTLLVPATNQPLPDSAPSQSATPWRQAGRVLVIDDETPVRDVAAELARSFGLEAVTAVDGADGIEKFRAAPKSFDLVLLDLTMPGMSGEETLAALRAIAPGVRVVVASGYSSGERIAQLASTGSVMFLQKPFTRGQLERKLREALGEGRAP